jgi:hypothetical protein
MFPSSDRVWRRLAEDRRLPAIVKDTAQIIDNTVRKPTGITQTLESRIPGLTSRVPAVIDASGNPVKRPANELGGANPFPMSADKGDAVLKEMARLGISTPTPPTSIKFRGKATALTTTERQQIAQQEGQELHSRLSRMVANSAWGGLADTLKQKRIAEVRKQIDENRPFKLARMRSQN